MMWLRSESSMRMGYQMNQGLKKGLISSHLEWSNHSFRRTMLCNAMKIMMPLMVVFLGTSCSNSARVIGTSAQVVPYNVTVNRDKTILVTTYGSTAETSIDQNSELGKSILGYGNITQGIGIESDIVHTQQEMGGLSVGNSEATVVSINGSNYNDFNQGNLGNGNLGSNMTNSADFGDQTTDIDNNSSDSKAITLLTILSGLQTQIQAPILTCSQTQYSIY